MPILDPFASDPLVDGRQSVRALEIRRGVERLLIELGAACLPELSLASGRRADMTALFPGGDIWIVEIKSSIEDLRADRKWPDYRTHCDRLFFATHEGVPADLFPANCGFLLADAFGAAMLRDAPEHRLAAATRKAVTLRFARAAALRLSTAERAGYTVINPIE